MFSQLKNIDTAFRHIRAFSIALILANLAATCYVVYTNARVIDKAEQRRYLLYNGKLLEAIASDKKTNLPVELRDHIRTFHQYFFSLPPDEKAIQATVTRALYLADESAKKQYDNLRESGYYNSLIAANVSQQIQVDSIRLELDSYPYRFTCYASQKLIRSSSSTFRRLISQGMVRDLNSCTDANPHGFLIQNWEVIQNADLETKAN